MNRAVGNPIALGVAKSTAAFTTRTGLRPTHVLLGRRELQGFQRWSRELRFLDTDYQAERLLGLTVVRVDADDYFDVALLLPRPGEGSLSPTNDPSLGSATTERPA